MVLKFETAADSFAACLDRSKLGIAIVAMIRLIATTIRNSKSEKQRLFFIMFLSMLGKISLRFRSQITIIGQPGSSKLLDWPFEDPGSTPVRSLQPWNQFAAVRESMGYRWLSRQK